MKSTYSACKGPNLPILTGAGIAMTSNTDRTSVYVFGGRNQNAYTHKSLNEIYILDDIAGPWKKTDLKFAGPRAGAKLAVIPASACVL